MFGGAGMLEFAADIWPDAMPGMSGAVLVVWARTFAEAANATDSAASVVKRRHRFIDTHLHGGSNF
jgi:hypothetical protein